MAGARAERKSYGRQRAAAMRFLATALTILALAACGGSGGGETPPSGAAPPSSPPPPAASFSLPVPNARPRETIAFVNIRLVSMSDDQVVEGKAVVVDNGRISSIVDEDDFLPAADVHLIQGNGGYLMPGLADLHVHISAPNNAFLYLVNGVTTIRIMWGSETTLQRRAAIASGDQLGPQMFVASQGFDGDPPFWPRTIVANSGDEARERVRGLVSDGYDFIKVYNRVTTDVYEALIDEAEAQGVPAVGHVPSAVGLDRVLETGGLKSMAHLIGYPSLITANGSGSWASALDSDKVRAAVERTVDAGLWNDPTLTVLSRTQVHAGTVPTRPEWRYLSREQQDAFFHPTTQPPASRPPQALANRRQFVKALVDGGAPIILGTDAGVQYVLPGYSIHEELELLVEAGLTPYLALRAGTVEAAAFLGRSDDFGQIAEGMRADLILLQANPLESVRHLRSRVGVMVNGDWWPEGELNTLLADLEAFNASRL